MYWGAQMVRLEIKNGCGILKESWNPQPIPNVNGTDASNSQTHILESGFFLIFICNLDCCEVCVCVFAEHTTFCVNNFLRAN